MWLRAPTCQDILDVALNMRQRDHDEIFAVRAGGDRAALAYGLYAVLPRALACFVCGLDNSRSAQALVGVWPQDETGGLATANMFATSGFRRLAPPLIAHVRSSLIPSLIARGVRRVEARALASYTTSRTFMAACGATQECLLPDYGRSGECFALYAWRRSDFTGGADVPDEHSQER